MEGAPNELSELPRLQEEHERLLQSCQESIDKWEKLKLEYEGVHDTLGTLVGKVSHDIMVPFGSMAFMPGKLVHTNEILVLLGDNWFVKRSSLQAQQIVSRRKEYCCKHIHDLQQEMREVRSRKAFAADFQAAKESGYREISERLPDKKQSSVKQPRVAHKKAKSIGGTKKVVWKDSKQEQIQSEEKTPKSVTEIFARLEELEEQEKRNQELENIAQETQDSSEMERKVRELMKTERKKTPVTKKVVKTNNASKLKKMSNGKTSVRKSASMDAMSQTCSTHRRDGVKITLSSGDDNDKTVDQSGGNSDEEPKKTITFLHSKPSVTTSVSADNLKDAACGYLTPGNIYEKFLSDQQLNSSRDTLKAPLKSILKSTSVDNLELPNGQSHSQNLEEKRVKFQNMAEYKPVPRPASPQPNFHPEKAFTGQVCEHSTTNQEVSQAPSVSNRKVSKFKANRTKSR